MTSFDLLVILVFATSIGLAVLRGALKEIGTVLALALAALGGVILVKPLAAVVFTHKSSFLALLTVGGIVGAALFVCFYAAMHLGLNRLQLSARGAQVDRILGGAFGFLRGLVLVGLGFLAYAYYLDKDRRPEAVSKALTLPLAEATAGLFDRMAPDATRIDRKGAPAKAPEKKTSANAAKDGYKRGDRAALSEIVATVTTSDTRAADDAASSSQSPPPHPPSDAPR